MRRGSLLLAFLAPLAMVDCRGATEIRVVVRTDVPCSRFVGVGVATGAPGEIEQAPLAAQQDACNEDGSVGDIVLVPSGDRGAAVSFKVVGAVDGAKPEDCAAPPYGPKCIVARRALKYLPHTGLTVQVDLRSTCEGVSCDPSTTCVRGACAAAEIPDPTACSSGPCDEGALAPAPDAGGSPAGAWVRTLGPAAASGRVAVDEDAAGDVLVAISPYAANADVVVARVDPSGTTVWTDRVATTGLVYDVDVAFDPAGNALLLGSLQDGSATLDGAPLAATSHSGFFYAKLDPEGRLLWTRTVPSAATAKARALAACPSGRFVASVDFAGSLAVSTLAGAAQGAFAAAIVAFDASGAPLWLRVLDGGGNAEVGGDGVGCDAAGNVTVAGNFLTRIDLGGGRVFTTPALGQHMFVAWLSPTGDTTNARDLGGAYTLDLHAATNPAGLLAISGTAREIDLGGPPQPGELGFAATLTPDAQFAWSAAQDDQDAPYMMALAPNGEGLVFGDQAAPLAFGAIALPYASSAPSQSFAARLDAKGVARVARTYQATGLTFMDGALNAGGTAVVAGALSGALDVGGATATADVPTVFVARLGL